MIITIIFAELILYYIEILFRDDGIMLMNYCITNTFDYIIV